MDAPVPWHRGELLGFDLETTGIDRFTDVPVSYALVTAVAGEVVARDGALVSPGRQIPDGATAVHGITTWRACFDGQPVAEAIDHVATVLVEASERGVPVVGMNLSYDLTIVDVQSRRLHGAGLTQRGWSGPALDALPMDRKVDKFRKGKRTLQALCAHYGVALEDAHDASADAEGALRVVLALAARYPELADAGPEALHHEQVGWHREWAVSFDAYCRENGRPPLDPSEFVWPLAPIELAAREVA